MFENNMTSVFNRLSHDSLTQSEKDNKQTEIQNSKFFNL